MYVCLPAVNIDVFGHRSTFYSNIFVHETKSSILLSWSLLTLIKSHLFSKFLILFWVELIQLSLWIQALKLSGF